MSILLGILNSHFWAFYNIPDLGNHFKNEILLGKLRKFTEISILSNWEFKPFSMGFLHLVLNGNSEIVPISSLFWMPSQVVIVFYYSTIGCSDVCCTGS